MNEQAKEIVDQLLKKHFKAAVGTNLSLLDVYFAAMQEYASQVSADEAKPLVEALEACIDYMNNGQTDFHTVLDNAEEALSTYNKKRKP